MTKIRERRLDKREKADSAIMYSHLTDQPYSYYGATMRNTSDGGIYFESRYALEPGTKISVRKAYSSPCDLCYRFDEPDQMFVVRTEKFNAAADPVFGIGAARFSQSTENTDYDYYSLLADRSARVAVT